MARSVQSWCRCYANAEMADWNALMWAPVRIRVWLDLVQFQFRPFRDPTAQQQLASWHMAPLSSQRGRAWSVFSKGNTVITCRDYSPGTCSSTNMTLERCAAHIGTSQVHSTVWVEEEETSRGLGEECPQSTSSKLEGITMARALDGCCPLVAQSWFPRSTSDQESGTD